MVNQIEALEAQVKAYFERNVDAEVVYATADGNLFAARHKRDAENHALSNKLELMEFTRGHEAADKNQEVKAEQVKQSSKQEAKAADKNKSAAKKAANK